MNICEMNDKRIHLHESSLSSLGRSSVGRWSSSPPQQQQEDDDDERERKKNSLV